MSFTGYSLETEREIKAIQYQSEMVGKHLTTSGDDVNKHIIHGELRLAQLPLLELKPATFILFPSQRRRLNIKSTSL